MSSYFIPRFSRFIKHSHFVASTADSHSTEKALSFLPRAMYILFHSTVLFVFIDTRVKNFAFLPVAYVSGLERKGGAKSRKNDFSRWKQFNSTVMTCGKRLYYVWWLDGFRCSLMERQCEAGFGTRTEQIFCIILHLRKLLQVGLLIEYRVRKLKNLKWTEAMCMTTFVSIIKLRQLKSMTNQFFFPKNQPICNLSILICCTIGQSNK